MQWVGRMRRRAVEVLFAATLLTAAALVVVSLSDTAVHALGEHDHAAHDHGGLVCRTLPVPGAPEVCTHGPDKTPKGMAAASDRELRRRAATASYDPELTFSAMGAAPKVACIGDGKSGPRVQAIYARAKDVPDRYSKVLPLLRQYAANADQFINSSAAMKKSGRRIRFVTSKCQLDVKRVTLSKKGDDNFWATASEVANKGFNRSDRKYLIWVDFAKGGAPGTAGGSRLCGEASAFMDDRKSPSNQANVTTGFARVDRYCWGGGTEVHELLHTLGAVQPSAKNATKNGHCTDENDAMCYRDAVNVKIRMVCKSVHEYHVDCNHDDYFNPRPKAGTYLANKWNTANSRYLESTIAPPTEPVVKLPTAANRLAGVKWSLSATSTPGKNRSIAKWQWQVRDPSGKAKHPTCRFGTPGKATTTFWCDATTYMPPRIVATVWDNKGASNVKILDVKFASVTDRPTTLTFTQSPATLPIGGGTVKVTATLRDKATGKAIIGMPGRFDYTGDPVPTNAAGQITRSYSVTKSQEVWVSTTGHNGWQWQNRSTVITVPLPTVDSMTATFVNDVTSTTLGATPTISPNDSVRLTGKVTPADPGAQVTLWRRDGTEWVVADTAQVASNGDYGFGSYTFAWLDEGTTVFKVEKSAHSREAKTVTGLQVTLVKPTVTIGGVPTSPVQAAWWGASGSAFTLAFTATAQDAYFRVQRWDGAKFVTLPSSYGYYDSWAGQYLAHIEPPAAVGAQRYRIVVRDDAMYADANSAAFDVNWVTPPTATITMTAPSGSVSRYSAATVTGTMSAPDGWLKVQRRALGTTAWQDDWYSYADHNSAGVVTASISLGWEAAGTYEYRILSSNHANHRDGTSNTFAVTFTE